MLQARAHHWTAFVRKKAWSPSTQRTALNKISACLNYAVGQGVLDPHKFKVSKKELPRMERRTGIVTGEEQAKLEAGANGAFRDFLIGMRLSGCRPGELAGALIENLRLGGGILLVANKTARSTGEKFRTIYLSPELRSLIVALVDGREAGFIWRNTEGGPWNRWSLVPAMRRLRIRLGMREGITVYGFRHRFTSHALNDTDANPAHVARLLGHKDLNMLMKNYFQESPDVMLRAVAEITKRPPTGRGQSSAD